MDIHDQTLADLASVKRGIEKLNERQECSDEATKLEEEMTRAISNLREVMDNLHPQTLDILGLGPALESHLQVCPQCAHLADEARSLLARFADARLPDPPEDLVERTLTTARARSAATISGPADGEADSVGPGFVEGCRHHGGVGRYNVFRH